MPSSPCKVPAVLLLTTTALLFPSLSEARSRDRDRDGLSDRYERRVSHTNPRRKDTDRDGLRDKYELRRSHTNPRRRDTDGDGLSDKYELRRSHTNPRRRDTDRDGLADGVEVKRGSNPLKATSPGRTLFPGVSDLLPPETTITAGPRGATSSTSASFSFVASEPATFECKLDGGRWGRCGSPKAYSRLAAGRHAFAVRAKDDGSLRDPTPASRAWTVSSPPPPATDTTPPETSITAGPSGTVTTASASFSFSSSEPGSSFDCRLDGGAWSGCSSPKAYSGLQNGSHTFEVRAKDPAGNLDATPASRTWTVNVPPPPPPPPPSSGLVAAYAFDEAGGLTALDRSGAGNDGTISGAARALAGHSGGALSFDGVDDWVTVADAGSLDLATGMTLEAWVRPTAAGTSWRTVLMKEQPTQLTYALYAHTESGTPSGHAYVGSDQDVRGTGSTALNVWTHLAATYDGSTLRLYVNGSQVSSRTLAGPISTSSGALRIGGNSVWSEWFAGLIDDVRVYERALSASEVQADRDAPVGPPPPPDTEPPSAPSSLIATGSLVQASLSWIAASDNVGVTRYDVHRSTTAGFTPSSANRVAQVSGTSYVDKPLAAGTYHYRVVAADAAGNLSAASPQASATVTSDISAPTVSISSPTSGTVSGTTSVVADASDNVGVSGVQFKLDGAHLNAEDASSPYATSWNTAATANGSHTLTAVARDAAGNTTTSAPVTVTVQNVADTTPPDTTITAGPSGTVTTGDANFSFSSSEFGSSFECRLDGAAWSACSPPKAYSGLANGSHTFDVRARDAAGNLDATPASRAWTVSVTTTGADRYVATTGNDANACTAAAPCKTFARAHAVAVAGDVINVAPGIYSRQDVNSGSKAVTFRGQSGAVVRQLFANAANVTFDNLDVDAGGIQTVGGAAYEPSAANITFKNGRIGNVVDEKGSLAGASCIGCTYDNVDFHDVRIATDGVHLECLYSQAAGIAIKNSRFTNCAVMDVFFTRGTWWGQAWYGGFNLHNNFFGKTYQLGGSIHYYTVVWANNNPVDRAVIRNNTFERPTSTDAPFTNSVESCNTPAVTGTGMVHEAC